MQCNYYRLSDEPANSISKIIGEKKVIFFLQHIENTPSTLTFLSKMMGALQIDFNQSCLIIPINEHEIINGADLFRNESPLFLLFFGVSAKELDLKINWPMYRCLQMVNHKMILSEKISDIEHDKARKLKLWNELKFMFQSDV